MAKIDAFFKLMTDLGASDLHLAAGQPPMIRLHGEIERIQYPPFANDDLKQMLYEIAPDLKIKHFEETGDVDFAYETKASAPIITVFCNIPISGQLCPKTNIFGGSCSLQLSYIF